MDEETSGRDTFDKSGGWGRVAKEEITYVDRRYKILYTHHAKSLNVCNL